MTLTWGAKGSRGENPGPHTHRVVLSPDALRPLRSGSESPAPPPAQRSISVSGAGGQGDRGTHGALIGRLSQGLSLIIRSTVELMGFVELVIN